MECIDRVNACARGATSIVMDDALQKPEITSPIARNNN